MFNWNVEEMRLLTMPLVGAGFDKVFACESEVPFENKFEFVDRMQEGKLTYFYDMVKGFGEAIPSMKKSDSGEPTDYAKKAWVRANDTKELLCRVTDAHGSYGDFYLLGAKVNLFTYHSRIETKVNAVEESFINNLFHRQLEKCKDMEYDHFYGQDKTVQFLDEFSCKYCDHRISHIGYDKDFHLRVGIATNPTEKNKVTIETFYGDYKDKELSIEEVQRLDAELTKLDDLRTKIEQAEQAYEEARWSLAMQIKSMAN